MWSRREPLPPSKRPCLRTWRWDAVRVVSQQCCGDAVRHVSQGWFWKCARIPRI
jgi:hypothetical protein